MHIEADGNNNVGPFTLLSPTFAECVGEVSFYYTQGRYGYYMGTLQLEVTTDGANWTTIWTKSATKATAGGARP